MRSLWPAWSEYIPHAPTPKQLAFLMLPHFEAFYGGAAGGGKSDALLMGALQYVNVPGYSAIIFRKTFADLRLAGALIDRSQQWLTGTDAKWDGQQHRWLFPRWGSQVAFGYIGSELDKYRYQGSEFQYVAFDELTQFYEEDYLYLFSRVRRKHCPRHANKPDRRCKTCREFFAQSKVPLRIRSASNPGGLGGLWVRQRFQIERVGDIYRGTSKVRPHVPAFLSDNPYLEQEEYQNSLMNLDPVTREQLLRGDWGVTAEGRIRKSWVKRFSMSGEYINLGPDRTGPSVHIRKCWFFTTIDPAASAREGPGDTQIFRRAPSNTVISTWCVTPNCDLLWWDCRAFRSEIPDVIAEIKKAYKEHSDSGNRPQVIAIEVNGLGVGVYQMLIREGLPMRRLLANSGDKLVRATDFINRMSQGKVYMPQQAGWLDSTEAELFTWTGHPHEASDRIDTASYAAIYLSTQAANGGMSSNVISYDMPEAG